MVTWFSLAISITFRSLIRSPSDGLSGEGEVLLRLRGLAADDDLEPQHLVREVQRALELGDDARVRREFGHDVVPLGLSLDLEREPSAAPTGDPADLPGPHRGEQAVVEPSEHTG